jgi:hypothetical protein
MKKYSVESRLDLDSLQSKSDSYFCIAILNL